MDLERDVDEEVFLRLCWGRLNGERENDLEGLRRLRLGEREREASDDA